MVLLQTSNVCFSVKHSVFLVFTAIAFCVLQVACNVQGGSICKENAFITPSITLLGFYAACETKDQNLTFKWCIKRYSIFRTYLDTNF